MAIPGESLLNTVPSPQQPTLSSHYLDFAGGSTGLEQQSFPDLIDKESEVFGPRTISGLLAPARASEAMTADNVV